MQASDDRTQLADGAIANGLEAIGRLRLLESSVETITRNLEDNTAFLPAHDPLVLIEDTAQLRVELPESRALRGPARARQPARHYAITIRDLLRATLRHRPDRILLGKVRGGEAFELLRALNTGISSRLSTVHANSADQALRRFTSWGL